MLNLSQIKEPVLLLNKTIAEKNITNMANKAKKYHYQFRPHFKTHQSPEIGEWFRELGVSKITVSSVKMARNFADHGWKDITIASPVNLREMDEINELASRTTLHIILDSIHTIRFLKKNSTQPLNIWLDIDTGYKRSGLKSTQLEILDSITDELLDSQNLQLCGLFAHAGHSYQAKNVAEVEKIHQTTTSILLDLKKYLTDKGFANLEISIGDTPCCTMLDDLGAVDEIRPGTFIFGDLRQMNIGSCTREEIATAVACPVIGKYEDRNEVIIYGGGVHLSKDYELDQSGNKSFGRVAMLNENGWGEFLPESYVSHISQEIGTIKMPSDILQNIQTGSVLAIIPAHICLTANLLKSYLTLDGEVISRY